MPTILHNGKPVPAEPWDTVASALFRAGVRVFSRSVKFHRPRGLYCAVGKCGNCMMRIDGEPSVRACMTPVHDGLRVEDQNAYPSARFDLLSILRFTPPGFDPQRAMTRPQFVRPWFHRAVRGIAGWGRLPDPVGPRPNGAVRTERCELLVVGAGPAGLSAAIAAAASGGRVALADESLRLGGRCVREEPEAARDLVRRARALGVTILERATVAGIYPEGDVPVVSSTSMTRYLPDRIVLATGAPDSSVLFDNGDLPGVMTVDAAFELLSRGLRPGNSVLVVGAGARERLLAKRLEGRAQVTLLSGEASPEPGTVRGEIVAARGFGSVRAAVVATGSGRKTLRVDAICIGTARRPSIELAQQAGALLVESHGVLVPSVDERGECAQGVYVCGDLLAPGTIEEALRSGERVGQEAARAGRKREAPLLA